MKRREMRKAAYQSIVVEGKTHQMTFDTLRKNTENDKWLANEVSKIPSVLKNEQHRAIRLIYIYLLFLVILLRLFGVLSLADDLKTSHIIAMIALGMVVPFVGILGSIKRKIHSYYMMTFLSFYIIFNTISTLAIQEYPVFLIGLFPLAGVIVLSIFIPSQLKTCFKVHIYPEEIEGMQVKNEHFIFDDKINTNYVELPKS
jgi:hypothetical protein